MGAEGPRWRAPRPSLLLQSHVFVVPRELRGSSVWWNMTRTPGPGERPVLTSVISSGPWVPHLSHRRGPNEGDGSPSRPQLSEILSMASWSFPRPPPSSGVSFLPHTTISLVPGFHSGQTPSSSGDRFSGWEASLRPRPALLPGSVWGQALGKPCGNRVVSEDVSSCRGLGFLRAGVGGAEPAGRWLW